MSTDLVLAKIDKAKAFLVEATGLMEVKHVIALASAAQAYARQVQSSTETMNHAAAIRLRAERRLGELLKETPKNKGTAGTGRPKKGGAKKELPNSTPTLAESGISKKLSSRAQLLSSVPEEEFEAAINVPAGRELNYNRVANDIKREQKQKEHAKRKSQAKQKTLSPPQGPFNLILADPPWKYDEAKENRKIENHYDTATVAEIVAHLPSTISEDCLLFMWATAPKLIEAIEVMRGWGFRYRTHAIWDKQKIGMGYWFRGQHELLLVGTRGKVKTPSEQDRRSSIFTETRGNHSAKPACVYEWVESAFPDHSKLEMYCRKSRDGWASWGNEI